MADPKYANLPGIDTSETDIYESGDLPEDDQQWVPEELSSESVEAMTINTRDAFERFNSKFVSGSVADFSGKIGAKGGYDIGDFTIAGPNEVETKTQKFQRLKLEIAQLSVDVAKDDGSGPLPADLVNQVAMLQTQLASQERGDGSHTSATYDKVVTTLNEISTQKASSQSTHSQECQGSYNLLIKPDQAQQKYGARLSEIEQRIASLEKCVGTDTEHLAVLSAETKHKSLKAAVEALEVKRSLLDPERLPQVDTRLQAVLNKLNEIGKARKQAGAEEVASEKKINELYDTVHKWESVCASLPSIIHRLETLNELHLQAAEFSLTLNHIETVQGQISSKLSDTVILVNQVESTFKQNTTTIQANLQSLEQRIQKL